MEINPIKEKIAIVAGGGDLPIRVINEAKYKGLNFIVVGIKGISPKSLVNSYDNFWFYMGEVGDFINKLKNHNVKKILFVGSVLRPSLLSLKLDDVGKKFVEDHFSQIGGDDSLLSKVIAEIESYGFKIIAAQDIAEDILASRKVYTKVMPSKEQLEEIARAFDLAKKISVFDIGQSLIFQQNIVIAVEGVEGTAKLILRSKKLIKKETFLKKISIFFLKLIFSLKIKTENSKIGGAFLVKVKKVHQDMRVDLPTIGHKTILQAKQAGLVGIVIEAESTIILNELRTIELANRFGIFIIAV
ncbi:MAG: UDP-2,3-diacylglucosamine diphosphatase LpxI [Alphaproteobacteria bacterium]|nr:UDP-2,3-diacylglucosamine diphosphatase LpxI [Alphaproteobacteria bacterium]